MRIYPECCPCMIGRTLLFCRNLDEKKRYRVVRELCKLFSEEFNENMRTTDMAAKRNELFEKLTKEKDPLKGLKEGSIRVAKKIYPKLKRNVERIKDPKKRFRRTLMIALAGNVIEFGPREHKLDINTLENEIYKIVGSRPAIDDTGRAYKRIKNARTILYLVDNAGELVFDRVFIEELKNHAEVIVSPLSRPIQDDATVEDVRKVGIDKIDNVKIIPKGGAIGVFFGRTTKNFDRAYGRADVVVAKGMACYETLIDFPDMIRDKVLLLMKVKCTPVSKDIKVPLGSTVVKLF